MSAESLSMQEAPLCSSRSISTGKKWKKIFPPLPAGEEEELLSPFVPKPSRPYDAVGLVWMTDSIYFMHHHDEGLHNSHFLKQEYSSALLLQQTSSTKDATLLDFHTLTLCINAPSTSSINLIPSSLRYLDNPSDAEGHATGCDNILPLATAFSEALYSKWIEIINKSRNTSRNSSRMHSNNNSPLARHAGGRKEMDFDISEVYSEEDEIATKYPYNIQIDESVQDPLNKSIGIMQTSSQSDDESQYADSKQGEVRVEGVADKRFVASTDVIGSIIVPTPLSLPARQSITDIIEKGHLKLRSMQSSAVALAVSAFHTNEIQSILKDQLGNAKILLVEIAEEYISVSLVEIQSVLDSSSKVVQNTTSGSIDDEESAKMLRMQPFTPKTPKRVRWSQEVNKQTTSNGKHSTAKKLRSMNENGEDIDDVSFNSEFVETDGKSTAAPSPYDTSRYLDKASEVSMALPFSSVSIEVACSEGDMSFGYQDLDEQVIIDWIAVLMHLARIQGWSNLNVESVNGHEGVLIWRKLPQQSRWKCLLIFKLFRKASKENTYTNAPDKPIILDLKQEVIRLLTLCHGVGEEIFQLMLERETDYDRMVILDQCLLYYCQSRLLLLNKMVKSQSLKILDQLLHQYGEETVLIEHISLPKQNKGHCEGSDEITLQISSTYQHSSLDVSGQSAMVYGGMDDSFCSDFSLPSNPSIESGLHGLSSASVVSGFDLDGHPFQRKSLKTIVESLVESCVHKYHNVRKHCKYGYPSVKPLEEIDAVCLWQETSSIIGMKEMIHFLKKQFQSEETLSAMHLDEIEEVSQPRQKLLSEENMFVLPVFALEFGSQTLLLHQHCVYEEESHQGNPLVMELTPLSSLDRACLKLVAFENPMASSYMGNVGLALTRISAENDQEGVGHGKNNLSMIDVEEIVWLNSEDNMNLCPMLLENSPMVTSSTQLVIKPKINLLLSLLPSLQGKGGAEFDLNMSGISEVQGSKVDDFPSSYHDESDKVQLSVHVCQFLEPFTSFKSKARRGKGTYKLTWADVNIPRLFIESTSSRLGLYEVLPHVMYGQCLLGQSHWDMSVNNFDLTLMDDLSTLDRVTHEETNPKSTVDGQIADGEWMLTIAWKRSEIVNKQGLPVIPTRLQQRKSRVIGTLPFPIEANGVNSTSKYSVLTVDFSVAGLLATSLMVPRSDVSESVILQAIADRQVKTAEDLNATGQDANDVDHDAIIKNWDRRIARFNKDGLIEMIVKGVVMTLLLAAVLIVKWQDLTGGTFINPYHTSGKNSPGGSKSELVHVINLPRYGAKFTEKRFTSAQEMANSFLQSGNQSMEVMLNPDGIVYISYQKTAQNLPVPVDANMSITALPSVQESPCSSNITESFSGRLLLEDQQNTTLKTPQDTSPETIEVTVEISGNTQNSASDEQSKDDAASANIVVKQKPNFFQKYFNLKAGVKKIFDGIQKLLGRFLP